MRTLPIMKLRTIWLSIAGALVVLSIIFLSLWGLRLGIDFTGGSILELSFPNNTRPSLEVVRNAIHAAGVTEAEVRFVGEDDIIGRFKTVDEGTHQAILDEVKKNAPSMVQKSFDSIGPVVGAELGRKAILALALTLAAILAYISFVFRKVSRPVQSWKYGTVAIVTLFHDLIITIGVFALLGKLAGIEINASFIAAFLTVLGFSVHDTIVIFDRIRENLLRTKDSFEVTVNRAVNESFARSINTSLTTLLSLVAIFLFGGESLRYFSLALIVGIAAGTYSSIFFSSPLLIAWHNFSQRKAEK